jgi:hypothetical protein
MQRASYMEVEVQAQRVYFLAHKLPMLLSFAWILAHLHLQN